jgi:hypothetical protein
MQVFGHGGVGLTIRKPADEVTTRNPLRPGVDRSQHGDRASVNGDHDIFPSLDPAKHSTGVVSQFTGRQLDHAPTVADLLRAVSWRQPGMLLCTGATIG